jgi:hypothetical protein
MASTIDQEQLAIQLVRIRARVAAKSIRLNPPATAQDVAAFEGRHGIVLPVGYRMFITELGNGGAGPIGYGVLPLGKVPSDMRERERDAWTELRAVRRAFPFTKAWVWENGEKSSEGDEEQIPWGSICLGTDGCGMYWHLIVTGPDRGVPWMLAFEGIQPVCPKRTFLQWYEDWLDGKDSFYAYPA